MKIYTITVAFCPAAQLARCLAEQYVWNDSTSGSDHYVVQGHYPINREKNNRDIEMITHAFGLTFLDPGRDLGSAQSQWWALQQIGAKEGDYWINLDPDSCCDTGWELAATTVLEKDENCIVISCRAPLIDAFIASKNYVLDEKIVKNEYRAGTQVFRYGIARQPIPFNLSMWRYSFFKELGCIPQAGEMWGEVEAVVHQQAKMRDKYHAYLLDHVEEEQGKFMQDKQLLEYKDLSMRSPPDKKFYGIFREYLAWKYPHLLEMDTKIPDGTIFQ